MTSDIRNAHFSDVTWSSWRLKSPECLLHDQPPIPTNNKENSESHQWPVLKESAGDRWISLANSQDSGQRFYDDVLVRCCGILWWDCGRSLSVIRGRYLGTGEQNGLIDINQIKSRFWYRLECRLNQLTGYMNELILNTAATVREVRETNAQMTTSVTELFNKGGSYKALILPIL